MARWRILVSATVAALWASAMGLAAGRPNPSHPVGYVATQGQVWVDRQPAPSGTAVFAGDVITTGQAAMASVSFQKGASATLSENGELAIPADAPTPSIKLTKGTMALRNASGEPVHVNVQGVTVKVEGQPGFPAVCRIAFVAGAASVFADTGRVEIERRGMSRLVLPGRPFRLGAGMPQAAGEPAGKVTHAIPQETVQHPGQTEQVDLTVNDGVVWEDLVRTLGTGRVRISLADGSVLNVGARSTMRIVKHDAESQQTEIEMQLGKLRGQVVKITKPGGNFQVKTNTAVIGVVGTIFIIDALQQVTRAWCVDGALTIRNIDPNIRGERTVRAGEQSSVQAGQPPSAPTPAPPSQITQGLNLTNAGEVPSPEFTKLGELRQIAPAAPSAPPPVTAGVQGVTATTTAVNATTAALGGVSAGLSGVAITKASDAREQAELATSAAAGAVDAANSAASTAEGAANAATAFSNGVMEVINELSPGGGCVCIP